MRPSTLSTRIFLDGGDPQETKQILDLLGFLDGQTTNPSLVAKNPEVQARLARGEKFNKEEVYAFYRDVVQDISRLIPSGSVSVEVYTDHTTTADEMFTQGREMFSWIANAHIKFPVTHEGLMVASRAIKEGMRVNMTLCFGQEQAAAVYAATRGAKKGQVFVSPFVGRLDDKGKNGMDLIANILSMYRERDGHMEVLTASVRNLDHLLYAIALGSDIISCPFKVLQEWVERGLPVPPHDYRYNTRGLKPIPYVTINLDREWDRFDIGHKLTDQGIERFSRDWNSLIIQ